MSEGISVTLRAFLSSPGALFLLRLDFRLDEGEGALSKDGRDGPAADLERDESGLGPREAASWESPYSGLDIVVTCLPFLLRSE